MNDKKTSWSRVHTMRFPTIILLALAAFVFFSSRPSTPEAPPEPRKPGTIDTLHDELSILEKTECAPKAKFQLLQRQVNDALRVFETSPLRTIYTFRTVEGKGLIPEDYYCANRRGAPETTRAGRIAALEAYKHMREHLDMATKTLLEVRDQCVSESSLGYRGLSFSVDACRYSTRCSNYCNASYGSGWLAHAENVLRGSRPPKLHCQEVWYGTRLHPDKWSIRIGCPTPSHALSFWGIRATEMVRVIIDLR